MVTAGGSTTTPEPSPGNRPEPASPGLRTLGVEEEFHLVDVRTRSLAARAPEVLALLPDDGYVAEMQKCVVEINSSVVDTLTALRTELQHRRAVVSAAAATLGLGVVAAGSMPLAVPAQMQVTGSQRYRQMLADYQLLAREQLICGLQIHVGIDDRDLAVRVAQRVGRYLPTLLAISASSPFESPGVDTGYASSRMLIWQRWPTTGPALAAVDGADYDAQVQALIDTGVITDAGMIYTDVRPASLAPTLELRVCDSQSSLDAIVLIAGLFRAMVDAEVEGLAAGTQVHPVSPMLARAALWRAARSGLEGDLVDLAGHARPAGEVVRELVEHLSPWLQRSGDLEAIEQLTDQVLRDGSSASRQRAARRRRGLITDVVDLLIAETANSSGASGSADTSGVPEVSAVFDGYSEALGRAAIPGQQHSTYDEVVDDNGEVREGYGPIVRALAGVGPAGLSRRWDRVEAQERAERITFGQANGRARSWPVDLTPRIVRASDWAHLTAGLRQRVLALDAFLQDIYGDQEIVREGILPTQVLDLAPGYRTTGRLPGKSIRAHVAGLDLVCDGEGSWFVLEDNLRIPSGAAYAAANRRLLTSAVPEIEIPPGVAPATGVADMLLETLSAAGPRSLKADPAVVVLSSGWDDSAWYEHQTLADSMGVPIVLPRDLIVQDDRLHRVVGDNTVPIDVVYARIDEDMLLSSTGADGARLRSGLLDAVARGHLTIANALGNGVGDDKAVYAHVPAMIDFYLGEQPLLHSVPTFICAERDQRDHVLERIEQLVVKPIDGLGGAGVLIGPRATDEEIEQRRRELLSQPERFIAQELVTLSTHPVFNGEVMRPRRVDLRTFVHVRDTGHGATAVVSPVALTRVAAPGSWIVNSSAGGGSKDTWIMEHDAGPTDMNPMSEES